MLCGNNPLPVRLPSMVVITVDWLYYYAHDQLRCLKRVFKLILQTPTYPLHWLSSSRALDSKDFTLKENGFILTTENQRIWNSIFFFLWAPCNGILARVIWHFQDSRTSINIHHINYIGLCEGNPMCLFTYSFKWTYIGVFGNSRNSKYHVSALNVNRLHVSQKRSEMKMKVA